MKRRVQYAKTADGVSIALWTLGEGEPLVYMTGGPWNHIELWDIPECRRWYERLAQNRMLVRYDVRGTGLSDREVVDYSLDAKVLDLEAVVNQLGLDRFSLFGAANPRRQKLMRTLDGLNDKFGAGAVCYGQIPQSRTWYMNQQHRSRRYTTHWHELPVVK